MQKYPAENAGTASWKMCAWISCTRSKSFTPSLFPVLQTADWHLSVFSPCICFSFPLSFCSLIASLLWFPRFFLLFPSNCTPSSDVLWLHIDILALDLLWLIAPLPSLPHLLSALQLYSSLLFFHPSPTYTELSKLQKMVLPRETGGMSLELGAVIGCREKQFPSWRWRVPFNENERHKDYLGRRKEKPSIFVAVRISSPFQKGRISGSFSHVKCIYANTCYEPDMSPCSGSAGLVLWYFSPHQGISWCKKSPLESYGLFLAPCLQDKARASLCIGSPLSPSWTFPNIRSNIKLGSPGSTWQFPRICLCPASVCFLEA